MNNNNQNNQNQEPNIYIGNGKQKERQSGDKYIVASICLDDINAIPEQYISVAKNGKRYTSILINPYKGGANEYGNTHSLKVNTFKKEENPF